MGGRTTVKHDLWGTPEYSCWAQMVKRCHRNKPGSKTYHLYQGRGIAVCDRWRYSVTNFYADMGPRPSNLHSIERIDNNGDYFPGNCKWATRKEQQNNTRLNRHLTLDRETMNLGQWAERMGMKRGTLNHRLENGWSLREALLTPVNLNNSRAKR